jgi:hypothetical protein
MPDTGFPQADVEDDFLRARRHEVLATLAHRLRRQPSGNDGHHRVSIAAATGHQTIDAYVTEILTTLSPGDAMRRPTGSTPT